MKQLYFFNKQFSFDGEHWIDCFNCGKRLHYGVIPENEFQQFDDFDFAYYALINLRCSNPYSYTTLFNKKAIKFEWLIDGRKKMTARNFKPFTLRWYYEPCAVHYTMKHLMEELPADELIEYCKDRGLTIVKG